MSELERKDNAVAESVTAQNLSEVEAKTSVGAESVTAQNLESLFVAGDFAQLRKLATSFLDVSSEADRKVAADYLARIAPDAVVLYSLAVLVMVFAAITLTYMTR